jgi:hypothetical protein
MVKVIQPLLNEDEEAALQKILEYLADERDDFLALPPGERHDHIYQSVLRLRGAVWLGFKLFELGRYVATPGAVQAMEEAGDEPWVFLHRHQTGDWGEVGRDDWLENECALTEGSRLFSVYRTTRGVKLWVITEWDRSATTILLPEEY